jgi:Fe-Mn family superoxide dismutase
LEEQLEKKEQKRQQDVKHRKVVEEAKQISVEKLPYSYSALKQFIDPETMNVHYNKHYKGYVDKLNAALDEKEYGELSLEEIIKTIERFNKFIRNQAGGAFNHQLFWKMLSPKPMTPKGLILKLINKNFGSFASFKKKFDGQAKDRFGSGWCWLVLTKRGTLKIMSTPNQDNPLMDVVEQGGYPLLGLDLWEHAYYLRYRNRKEEYIKNFWKVVNWDFVTKMYEMKVETKLLESTKMKQVISEGKSEMCSKSETEFYRMLFNVNQEVKWTYMNGINKILRDAFSENFIEKPDNNQLSGVYDLEGTGRSVINKLNTNYTTFCILLRDLNQVISKIPNKQPISFTDKTPAEQKKEVERFISALNYFKDRIFDKDSSTLHNILRVLTEKDKAGSKREEITASILKRFFGKSAKVELVGELGNKKDAIQGVDLEIIKDGKLYTAQVKPFREMKETEDGISLEGTASVKLYKTDWMVFQRGKNVLVFNQKPKIVDGNFLFPSDSLLYNI